MKRGIERFTYILANQLIKNYNIKITLYVWDTPDRVDWGSWDSKIEFKFVPYSKYLQSYLARVFYRIWSFSKKTDAYLINFLYHGESVLPKTSNLFFVLHAPASLIPNRYKYIAANHKKYNSLTFISVSEFVKKTSALYFNSNQNFVIHHGLDFSSIKRKTFYKQDNKLKILTVAALESWKGIQHVISVFSKSEIKENFEYHIIGEGPYREQLNQEVKRNNAEDSILFFGKKNNVESLYCNYDIYCQLSDGEAFGLSIIEAMGAGLPTIVNNISPFDCLFPSDKVIKIEKNNNEELKFKLLELLSANKRQKLGLKGQEFVSTTFTLEKMVSHYYNLFKN